MKKGNELNTIDFPPQNWQPSSNRTNWN